MATSNSSSSLPSDDQDSVIFAPRARGLPRRGHTEKDPLPSRKAHRDVTSEDDSHRPIARPFLKWAGGKGSLVPMLLARMPKGFHRYHEPFLGGGALFFALGPSRAILSDANEELINCFRSVRRSLTALIADLGKHRYEKEYYLRIRNADRIATFKYWSDVQRASRMIFLNRTCFNGLYRLNSKGHFNVPFGRYSNPTILDEQRLRSCHVVLEKAKLRVASFEESFSWMERGDFAYIDPPYIPLSSTSSFTSYTDCGFGKQEHEKLAALCSELHSRGVNFLLSNSDTPFTRDLYRDFDIESVQASRMINSKAKQRGKISELLIRNY